MRDIVEEVLEGDGEATPPGEVQDVQVAVVGIGAAGTDRLTGIGRRLRGDAFTGQVPTDVDAVGVDLPGEETTVTDWEPAAWHVVESLNRPDRGGRPQLTLAAADRLQRFCSDELARYDVLVATVDGTDPAAVAVAADLAATFRGGVASPAVCVPTVEAADPPTPLLGAESGWLPDTRDRFGPDAVVPVEHGRATEVAAGESGGRGPLAAATETTDDTVERVAEAVTAALAEALGTRVQFGSLADDLHRFRGRVVAHVGRDDEGLSPDAEALAGDALATPVSGEPPDWRPGGPVLAHLRSHSPNDAAIDAAIDAGVDALDGADGRGEVGGTAGDARTTFRSYRHTATRMHELFLFRIERPDEPAPERHPHVAFADDDLDDDLFTRGEDDVTDEFDTGSGLDVVR
ncbi:hypothetical protein [Haloglomus salinum]|uniref:hypothetical protein n=1 Tax=Haloglomus salinum TaxID=2962673 RepID=UPI0020C9E445|nr:hypothetical protein [Haloglomus salinum]